MSIRIIPIADAQAWTDAIGSFADADVYHDEAYVRSVTVGREAILLLAERGSQRIALPLALNLLPEPWNSDGLKDAESPYGYAGPLIADAGSIDPELWDEITAALSARGVINAFLRLHPFSNIKLPESLLLPDEHATAWIPLSGGVAAAFAGGRCATQRSQVNRATKLGFQARIATAPSADVLEGFSRIYDETMRRLSAAAEYYFTEASYQCLARLGDRLTLIEIVDGDGAVHAAALFMRGRRWAHYHLSARSETSHNAAGSLLFVAAADWAAAHGCDRLHLGGGTSTDVADSLLAYKRRIGSGDACFRVAGLVCDREQHHRIVDEWRERSGMRPRWFQAYRQSIQGVSA